MVVLLVEFSLEHLLHFHGKVKIQLNKDIILYKFYKKGKIENGEAKIEPSTTPAVIQYTGVVMVAGALIYFIFAR